MRLWLVLREDVTTLLIGEKGTGKSSTLLDAIRKVDGEGISIFEAHADLEVFRVSLGKALNYVYHEDYLSALFSIRGPRDTTPTYWILNVPSTHSKRSH